MNTWDLIVSERELSELVGHSRISPAEYDAYLNRECTQLLSAEEVKRVVEAQNEWGKPKMKKAIVVGRHAGVIPGYEAVEQRNITFPATSAECIRIFESLLQDAFIASAALIFQALPGQLAAAICTNIGTHGPITHVPVGVIVNTPGERPAGVEYTFDAELFEHKYQNDVYYGEVERIAKHYNPNAKVNGFTVTVDPPMKFVFSHIEWLNG